MDTVQRNYLREVFCNGIPEEEKRNIQAMHEEPEPKFTVRGVYHPYRISEFGICETVLSANKGLCKLNLVVAVQTVLIHEKLGFGDSQLSKTLYIKRQLCTFNREKHESRMIQNEAYRTLYNESKAAMYSPQQNIAA